jgi:hypothetical protein
MFDIPLSLSVPARILAAAAVQHRHLFGFHFVNPTAAMLTYDKT